MRALQWVDAELVRTGRGVQKLQKLLLSGKEQPPWQWRQSEKQIDEFFDSAYVQVRSPGSLPPPHPPACAHTHPHHGPSLLVHVLLSLGERTRARALFFTSLSPPATVWLWGPLFPTSVES